ncbi:Crp/Fnr family transcriptional regulator [Pontibacter sp. G13]|uniref:Crp/Fnr family transcriptional regulator n=1 Tax=Pontibacter sp. G13 TaxID=3074898 RepID=UPI00288C24E7|nr:Crp/Fnr family transcriptional regulator [Pontibacter sp. G13]WNJ18783.1 Crp/Fnr family transcriptional regulator [Pontibacter sp. G13]
MRNLLVVNELAERRMDSISPDQLRLAEGLQLLRKNSRKYLDISDPEFGYYASKFKLHHVPKKGFLLQQGEICQFEGFVISGCFRHFTLDASGNEQVLSFAVRDWWTNDIDSFTNQTPAFLSIQALADSEVLMISKQDKESLYDHCPKVERLFRMMTQKALVAMQQRMIREHTLSAKERYQHFIQTYPGIANMVTNIQMASYLGISHEFLSKIRKQIASQS